MFYSTLCDVLNKRKRKEGRKGGRKGGGRRKEGKDWFLACEYDQNKEYVN